MDSDALESPAQELRDLRTRVAELERAQHDLRAKLAASEARFDVVTTHVRDVFWIFDWVQQRVAYASPAFETLWGRPVSSLYTDYGVWARSIHPDDREYAGHSFARALDTGGGEACEYRVVRPDGEIRWVSDRAFPVTDPDGRVVQMVGVAEDVTARKHDERERERLESQVLQAQKLESLGLLAGGIAHDFNNLLMGILGNADLALMELPPGADLRYTVEQIETAALRAAELTNQMLAYSGRAPFVVGAVDLNRLVHEMTRLLEAAVSRKALLSLDLAEGLPAVEADSSQIRQVVMNLITNASEALEGGEGVVTIRTDLLDADREFLSQTLVSGDLPEGPYVLLEVVDTGVGMSESTAQKIFDPFFTTKFTGRGLGLASVLGIVRAHRGAIRVSSEPGHGSTFQVLFPVTLVEAATEPGPVSVETPLAAERTVLVVDDDASVRDVATRMLQRCGFRVLTAVDGEDGIDVFESHRDEIDLVLLDVTMPRLGGEEVFHRLQQIRPGVPVLLSSGYAEEEASATLEGAGLAGFIQKPYRSGVLAERVLEIVGDPPEEAKS